MKKLCLIVFTALATLIACNNGVKKKVMILGKGDISADGGNITLKGTTGSSDKTIDLDEEALTKALFKDLHKSLEEAYATEIGFIYAEISHTLANLKS